MNRDFILLAGIGLISVVAGIFVFQLTASEPKFISAQPGQANDRPVTYADLAFNDVDGISHKLGEWNKPVQVINFWAPWCAPCRREIPALINLQARYTDKVQFIGLAFDSVQNVRDFSDQFAFNYPLLLVQQSSRRLNAYFGNASGGLPFTVILNGQREIVFQHAGEISEQQLEQRIASLL